MIGTVWKLLRIAAKVALATVAVVALVVGATWTLLQTRRGGELTWTIRFTPRRPKSIWSQINIRRIAELKAGGRLHEAGLATFEARDPERQKRYSFENRDAAFSAEQEAAFRKNRKAWANFSAMPPSYRHPATWWVVSAKREDTRARRLATLIKDSAARRKIKPLTLSPKKT